MIIDIHAHLDRDPITKIYKVDELFEDMKTNKIDKRVISTYYGASIATANDKIIELVKIYPNQLIGCAVINPKMDDAVEEMQRMATKPEIKMIEFNSLEHGYRPEKFAYNIMPILETCKEHHLIVKLFTGHGFYTMPDQWAYYTKKFNEITFIFEHMGGSDFTYGTVDLCKEEKNIMLDTSYESEVPALNKVFRELPTSMLLYGSNYPYNFTDLSIMKFETVNLSKEEENQIFYENAQKLLNI